MDEAVKLFHRMKAAAELIHGQGDLSAALRGVLRDLQTYGPQTVPQMARSRPVSRQHIQSLVNHLLEAGLVELKSNPAHRRSMLVTLTLGGKWHVASMLEREAKLFRALPVAIPEADLATTARVLKEMRETLAGRKFEETVQRLQKSESWN